MAIRTPNSLDRAATDPQFEESSGVRKGRWAEQDRVNGGNYGGVQPNPQGQSQEQHDRYSGTPTH